ncbi:MAG: hypothetical protein GY771_05275 [bacterium]|nr:hypothetical protein [bacterium]
MNWIRFIIAFIVALVLVNVLGFAQGILEQSLQTFGSIPTRFIVEQDTPWLVQMIITAVVLEILFPMLVYVLLVEKWFKESNIFLGVSFGFFVFLLGGLAPYLFTPMLLEVAPSYFWVHAAGHCANLCVTGAVIGVIYRVK